MRSIKAPTLLLWGDADPISPVPVGERLAALIPDARLRVVEGANHDLAQTHPKAVAEEVRKHLTASG
jgi:pimeloyl-ACP methyl ester carboxylesterase